MSLWRPTAMAVLLGLIFIALQYPIMQAAARLIGASEAVTGHAETYFYIRIWGAPFALPGYVIIGWLMGISRVKLSLMIQMLMNALNMLLSIEDTLAANAILWQIQYVMAYLFDGFANASSIIVGRAVGGQNVILCKRAFSLSAQWGCMPPLRSHLAFASLAVLFCRSLQRLRKRRISPRRISSGWRHFLLSVIGGFNWRGFSRVLLRLI